MNTNEPTGGANCDNRNEESLENSIRELEAMLAKNEVDVKPFETACQILENCRLKLLELIDWAIRTCKETSDSDALSDLYRKLNSRRFSEHFRGIVNCGSKCGNSSYVIRGEFLKNAHRIYDLIHSCNRQAVFHNIFRIFLAAGVPMPNDLIYAFDKSYSNDEFQTLLFAFVASVVRENKDN